jgi:hypothetical protein
MITGITANTTNKATNPFAVRLVVLFMPTIGDFGAEKSAKRVILVDLGYVRRILVLCELPVTSVPIIAGAYGKFSLSSTEKAVFRCDLNWSKIC